MEASEVSNCHFLLSSDRRPEFQETVVSLVSSMEVDAAFLRSRRGILKAAELVTLFAAFVCFAVGSRPKFIAAAALEFLLTSALMFLYLLKLHKRLSRFFWPLVDLFNSVFAACFLVVLSLMAVTTHGFKATLVGGVLGLVSVVLLCIDTYTLFKNITFNKPRGETQAQVDQ